MSHPEPITMLVINEHAEEIKLVTISMRGFFPGCRVEAVYSAEEAIEWASKTEWHLILLDEDLGTHSSLAILPELKRHVSSAAIIVQSDHTDSTSALQAMRAGADFFLYKKSPAFLTELLFYACEAMDKRDLRLQLDRTQERHRRLVETMPDIVYELDPAGRFVYVSGTVTPLLGYAPEELTGAHYSQLLPPDQYRQAEHQFNDRRTGARSARSVELHLLAKESRENPARSVHAEIHAKGLYDPQRRFLGTLGLVRDLSRTKQQSDKLHQLEIQLRETERLLTLAQRLTSVSRDLQGPLSTLLAESQQLLSTVRELGLEPKLEALTAHATEAAELGQELSRTIQTHSTDLVPLVLNDQLNDVLAADAARFAAANITLDRQFDAGLPTIPGDLHALREALTLLLRFIQQRVSALPGPRYLRVLTRLSPPAGPPSTTWPTLFPLSPVALVEVEFVGGRETGSPLTPSVATPTPASPELLQAYRIIQAHGGTIHIDDSVTGPIRIVLRLATGETAAPLASTPPRAPDKSPAVGQTVISPTSRPHPPVARRIERRLSERVTTDLPVHLTVGATPWVGAIVNLSAGGALLSFQAQLNDLDSQPVYLVMRTAVSVLELHGVLRERPLPTTGFPPPSLHETRLAIELTSLRSEEQAVLTSMIQAIQEGTLDVTVEGLVPSGESDVQRRAAQSTEQQPGVFDFEQRQDLRFKLAVPVRIESPVSPSGSTRTFGLTVNLSRNGACLQVKAHPHALEGHTHLVFTPASPIAHRAGSTAPSLPQTFTGQVVWVAPDPTAPSELQPSPSVPALRVGIRFQHLGQQEERALNRLLAQHVSSSLDLQEPDDRTVVISRSLECRNSRGQRLALIEDHARHPLAIGAPVVVLAPGFGCMRTDAIELAYELAAEGLRVVRYDAANHLGLSDGEMQATTLSGLQDDLTSILSFVRQTWPLAPVLVVAPDLVARVALKVASQQREVRAWVLLSAVFDVQHTLATVHRHDLVADYDSGARRGVTNLLGLNVHLDHFLDDLVTKEYADLATTLRDVSAIQTPVILFPDRRTDHTGDRQSWTSPETNQRIMAALGPQGTQVSSDRTTQEQAASPADPLRRIVRSILTCCREVLPALTTTARDRNALTRDATNQRRLEREQVRAHYDVSRHARRALWQTHVQHASTLAEISAHWQLLDHLYRRLSPLDRRDVILDVGCGSGEVPRLILMNQAYRSQHTPRQLGNASRYIGLGTPFHVLDSARSAFDSFLQELDRTSGGTVTAHSPLTASWICADWQDHLPIAKRRCTRVLSILSLNFVDHPLTSLREMMRTLAPGGRLLIACLTPDTDLSDVYRRHLLRSQQAELSEPNQTMLLYLGWLRQAVRQELAHAFDQDRLTQLLIQSGASRPRVSRLMGGHVLIAVAEKPPSSS